MEENRSGNNGANYQMPGESDSDNKSVVDNYARLSKIVERLEHCCAKIENFEKQQEQLRCGNAPHGNNLTQNAIRDINSKIDTKAVEIIESIIEKLSGVNTSKSQDPDLKTVLSNVKNLVSDIQDRAADKEGQNKLKEDLSTIKQVQGDVVAKIDDLVTKEEQSKAFDQLKDNIDKRLKGIEDSIKTLEDVFNNKVTVAQNELEKVREESKSLEFRLSEKERALSEVNEELREAQKAISEKDGLLEKERREHSSQREELESTLKDTEALKRDAEERSASLATLLSEKEKALSEADNKLRPLQEALEIYVPVMESMQKCEIFAGMLNEKMLNGKGSDTLFEFACSIGKTLDFAMDVYKAALGSKKNSKEPLASEEIEVYAALNDCYRSVWGIDFDIFVLPGGQSVKDAFNPVDFNKSESENMLDPKVKDLKYSLLVYVPRLMAKNGNQYYPAQVKAGNVR